MRQLTIEEFEVIKQLARASQNATTKAQLAAITLEDKLNELRQSCDAPGNATVMMTSDGQTVWTDKEGKPFAQPISATPDKQSQQLLHPSKNGKLARV